MHSISPLPLKLTGVTMLVLSATVHLAHATLPAPNEQWSDWKFPWGQEVPGAMSASDLLPKPAGRNGPLVVRDGHFYSGKDRVRFWGINLAFAANFPTHQEADAVALRFAGFGINCVRLHHMDNQAFPNGIFTDQTLEKLSPEAMDRLDYFVGALAKQGVWCDLNLHVSRTWSRWHNWPNADKLMEYDKMVDLFDPRLIAAQKQYASDLLGHVNAYTHHRYADEPSIGIVEINNENSIFTWGGEQHLAQMPEPYAGELQTLWNRWLLKKYGSKKALAAAWEQGAIPLGDNLLADSSFATLGTGNTPWVTEQHETAKYSVAKEPDGVALSVSAVDGTSWHLQFNQPGLHLKKGKFYTLGFSASAQTPVEMGLAVSQAHEPWQTLGLAASASLKKETTPFSYGFLCLQDDDDARVSFSIGYAIDQIHINRLSLRPGGRTGLGANEDPASGSISRGGLGRADTTARANDWYLFLQDLDRRYFVGMREYLKKDLAVKMPVTGTIGLGVLGTENQAQMDFVDGHSYWEHPEFPHRQWDMNDWRIGNRPMVDHPDGATFFDLAPIRIAGKPFTVTEYQHSAPNEWEAEGIPLIASYVALQDWDGVFLFAYSHNEQYAKANMSSFFDIEGNPLKMPLMPLGARLFLGQGVAPYQGLRVVHPERDQVLATASPDFYSVKNFLRDSANLDWKSMIGQRFALSFDQPSSFRQSAKDESRLQWTGSGPGTGQYIVRDSHAAIFAGFWNGKPVDLGSVRIDAMTTPFASVAVLPADPTQSLEQTDHLLISAVGRGRNEGMAWNAERNSVGTKWGDGPPQIEVVKGTLSLPGEKPWHLFALSPEGKRMNEVGSGKNIMLGTTATMWYEATR